MPQYDFSQQLENPIHNLKICLGGNKRSFNRGLSFKIDPLQYSRYISSSASTRGGEKRVSKGELKCFQSSQIGNLPTFLGQKHRECQSTDLPGSTVTMFAVSQD